MFLGSSHAWYCESCKQKVLSDQRKKDVERIKSKKVESVCAVCGKKFFVYTKKQTCGRDCELKLRSMSQNGRIVLKKTREKIGEKNCTEWHIVSPDGEHYEFYNLKDWARNNCKLFGFTENEKNVNKICCGLSQVKGAMLGTNQYPSKTYKGWRVVVVYGPADICRLYQGGWSVNKIHDASGLSESKIRKILITKNLWSNDISKKIGQYLSEGKTQKEISDLLNVSAKVVNSYAPYDKGIYNYKQSQNALNIKKCRDKNKSG